MYSNTSNQYDCKVILFMFMCQFVVICFGITLMTIISLSKINIYYKIIFYILTTLLTFILEKTLFNWCMNNICIKFCCINNYNDISSSSISSIKNKETNKNNNNQSNQELPENLPYII